MKLGWLVIGLAVFTLACAPGKGPEQQGPDPQGPEVSADALNAEAISVETLAASGVGGAAAADAAPGSAADVAATGPKPRPEGLLAEVPPDPALAKIPAVDAPAVQTPMPPSSPEEVACLRKKGLWIRAGKSIAMTCVKITKDAGKQCKREQDCQGQCLARSMTCAPYDPLFGCNEVLQNDGARVTLCID